MFSIKNMKLFTIYCILNFIVVFPSIVSGGASDAIMNTQDYNQSSYYLVPIRVRDASGGDALQNGLPATAVYGFNGLGWDRIRGDITYGLDVDITRLPAGALTGATTPADAFVNPTDAVNSWSLSSFYNGTTWDRMRGTIANGLDVDITRLPVVVTGDISNAADNITTNSSTVTKASSGTVNSIIVNVVGTTSTVKLYNDASAPCDTNFVCTMVTTVVGTLDLNHTFSNGICALTTGGAAADITVLYR